MSSGATATFNLRTLEEIEGIIAGVARSIERLDDGTYGSCEHCGVAIAPELLTQEPLLVRCTTHMVKERPVLFADVPQNTGNAHEASAVSELETDEFVESGVESEVELAPEAEFEFDQPDDYPESTDEVEYEFDPAADNQ